MFINMENEQQVAPVAARIIKKAGGAIRVAKICGRSEASVHKWKWSKEKGGTGGLVPSNCAQRLMSAARRGEISITASDFFDEGFEAPK